MNSSPEQAPMSPEDRAMAEAAGKMEADAADQALMAHLQGRVVMLNVEVQRRDRQIAELEARLAVEGVDTDAAQPGA